jgi:hypothetical protein
MEQAKVHCTIEGKGYPGWWLIAYLQKMLTLPLSFFLT